MGVDDEAVISEILRIVPPGYFASLRVTPLSDLFFGCCLVSPSQENCIEYLLATMYRCPPSIPPTVSQMENQVVCDVTNERQPPKDFVALSECACTGGDTVALLKLVEKMRYWRDQEALMCVIQLLGVLYALCSPV